MKTTISLLALLSTGLSAGLFYAWSVSVIPGTKRMADQSYLEAMQQINRAILNPGFFAIFFGALLLMLWSSYLEFKADIGPSFFFTLAALIVYLAGTVGVTAAGNVPLNEALDLIELNKLGASELKATRQAYELKWNRLHNVRTVFSVISFVLLLLAIRNPAQVNTTFI
ncbi:MAG: DUF1772 domain-containing protein [Roseivirga sp.]|nr:DUF1772 domain-containing protein [Roseivirga sp.]